jgi:hypothetical protein
MTMSWGTPKLRSVDLRTTRERAAVPQSTWVSRVAVA